MDVEKYAHYNIFKAALMQSEHTPRCGNLGTQRQCPELKALSKSREVVTSLFFLSQPRGTQRAPLWLYRTHQNLRRWVRGAEGWEGHVQLEESPPGNSNTSVHPPSGKH